MAAIPPAILPKRKAVEICKDVTGWKMAAERPDYSGILGPLRDYFMRHAFVADNEVEIRIGHAVQRGKGGKKFVPGLDREMFMKVFGTLLYGNGCWERQLRVKETDYVLGETRVSVNDVGEVVGSMVKRQVAAIDVDAAGCPFDFRVGVSREAPVELTREEADEVIKNYGVRRAKDRQSFKYKHWRYDMTMVTHSGRGDDVDPEDRAEMTNVTYEIELEIRPCGLEKTEFNALYLAESTLLKILDLCHMIEPVVAADVSFQMRPVKIRPCQKKD